MKKNIYLEFLNNHNYDIRISRDARWIDQKCSCDVLCMISDCILEYVDNQHDDVGEFTVSDIWRSEYARTNVINLFSKPDPQLKASNEYDKYFGQPIKLLSYSKILNSRKEGIKYYYSINNREILEKISLRQSNSLDFLYYYIVKVLTDSGIYEEFENFFKIQDKDSYKRLKDTFIDFTIKNTNINYRTECGRIFTKVLNPLSFKFKSKGTEWGRISKNIITFNEIQYNRTNFRDELSGKDKSITRKDYDLSENLIENKDLSTYTISKAKNAVRKYNSKYNDGKSEVIDKMETSFASQAHHIFKQSDFPEIADCFENIIMLTPNQHFLKAHPKNHTQYVDKDFQYICLIAKTKSILKYLSCNSEDNFYNFDSFTHVLDTGLKTDEFSKIEYPNISELIKKIDFYYQNNISDNKYRGLIKDNKLSDISKFKDNK